MKKHLLTLLMSAAAMAAGSPADAQNVVTTRDAYGHLVFSEPDGVKPQLQLQPQPSASKEQPKPDSSRYSGLVYWSNKEHRWKPVPTSNTPTMQAARKAAQEVDRLMARPADTKIGRTAVGSQPFVPGLSGWDKDKAPNPEAMDKVIDAAAQRHGVDANLVRAVVRVESNFNPRAVSSKGAMGLMQLMPYTAKSLNVGNAFDPNQNVDAGVRHLKRLLESYNGNVELSLAAYNAGSGAVNRNGGIPPYRETRDYVKKITDLYWSSGFKARVQETRDQEGHRSFTNLD